MSKKTLYDAKKQVALNQLHRGNPKSGDYWYEMFCSILLVIEVGQFGVIFLDNKKMVGYGSWTWDIEKVSFLSLKQFSKRLTYNTIPNKTWCDVVPNWPNWKIFVKSAGYAALKTE